MLQAILQSNHRRLTEVGVRANQDTTQGKVATWYGIPVPPGIDYIGDETIHDMGSINSTWRCWWYKHGKFDSITLDADIPHEEKILTTIAYMRMSNGDDNKGKGGSPP